MQYPSFVLPNQVKAPISISTFLTCLLVGWWPPLSYSSILFSSYSIHFHKTLSLYVCTSLLSSGKRKYLNVVPMFIFCYTVPKEIDFPQFNMKCSKAKRDTSRNISCSIMFSSTVHFMLYCGNLD